LYQIFLSHTSQFFTPHTFHQRCRFFLALSSFVHRSSFIESILVLFYNFSVLVSNLSFTHKPILHSPHFPSTMSILSSLAIVTLLVQSSLAAPVKRGDTEMTDYQKSYTPEYHETYKSDYYTTEKYYPPSYTTTSMYDYKAQPTYTYEYKPEMTYKEDYKYESSYKPEPTYYQKWEEPPTFLCQFPPKDVSWYGDYYKWAHGTSPPEYKSTSEYKTDYEYKTEYGYKSEQEYKTEYKPQYTSQYTPEYGAATYPVETSTAVSTSATSSESTSSESTSSESTSSESTSSESTSSESTSSDTTLPTPSGQVTDPSLDPAGR